MSQIPTRWATRCAPRAQESMGDSPAGPRQDRPSPDTQSALPLSGDRGGEVGEEAAVVSEVVPTSAFLVVAGCRSPRVTPRKTNGQRWRAPALRDYESRALPLSYG